MPDQGKIKILFTAICLVFFTYSACLVHGESQIHYYNFTQGFYEVVKVAESQDSDFVVMQESPIPESSYTYNASMSGLLEITINPERGLLPYITLDSNHGWEQVGNRYSLKLYAGESVQITLSPHTRFSGSRRCEIGGGSITLYEDWVWDDSWGVVNFTLIPAEAVNYDLYWAPMNPSVGDTITFYSLSNPEAAYSWALDGTPVYNGSSVFEAGTLTPGNHTIAVTINDEYGHVFHLEKTFVVKSIINTPEPLSLSIFNLHYPDSVEPGEAFTITVYIDYSLENPVPIQICLREQGRTISSVNETLDNSGSKIIQLHVQAPPEPGEKEYQLYFYAKKGDWTQFSPPATVRVNIPASEQSLQVAENSIISILIGYLLILIKRYMLGKGA